MKARIHASMFVYFLKNIKWYQNTNTIVRSNDPPENEEFWY